MLRNPAQLYPRWTLRCPIALQGRRRGRQGSCHMMASQEASGLPHRAMPEDGSANHWNCTKHELTSQSTLFNALIFSGPPCLSKYVYKCAFQSQVVRSEEHTSELQSQSNLVC